MLLQASSIFLYFYFILKKIKDSERNFDFQFSKKKTYENPKKTRELILVQPLRFNCPPIEIISGTSKLGEATFRCNDLIEANRIEASRS